MGKTERRNVSQKKKSPMRTSLKLRKEKKMKGGELKEDDVNDIINRNIGSMKKRTGAYVRNLITYLEDMKGYLDKPEYIDQVSEQTDKDKFVEDKAKFVEDKAKFEEDKDNIINMIKDYFKKSLPPDFSNNYTATIEEVIPILEKILKFLEDVIKLPSSTPPPSPFKYLYDDLKKNVVDVIQIMKAIAEGSEIKIAAASDDESGVAADDTTSTGAAADDATIDIDGLNEGLNKIGRIFVIGNMKENDNINVYEKLAPTARIIMAYMVEISQEKQTELNKAMNNLKIEQAINKIKKQDQPEHDILGFLSNTDIQNLLEGKGIISKSDIQNATQSLNELKSNVNEYFPYVDNQMVAPVTNAQTTQETFEANIQIDENRKKFVEIVQYLLDLVTKITKKVTFATTGTAASDDKYATTGTGKSGAAAAAASDDESADKSGAAAAAAADASEIAELKQGLDMINNIFNSGMGMDKNDDDELFEKLKLAKRVINAYWIYIDENERIKFKKYADDGKPDTLFFTSEDNESLLKGELIITETDILNARNRLNSFKSIVNDPNSLKNKVIDNSTKYPKYVLTKDTFEKKIDFLIKLLNDIEIKVKKKIEDTTKNASNKDTNEIEETNDITIDSDKELVTLNITDQEGHIIYSYILRFTREGKGVTSGNDSATPIPKPVKKGNDTTSIGNESESDSDESEEEEDTNVSSNDSNSNEDITSSDSNESEEDKDTNVSGNDSDSNEDTNVSDSNEDTNVNDSNEDTTGGDTGELLKKDEHVIGKYVVRPFRSFSFGGGGGRDAINDQYTIPTTVLTAKMNEPFTINDNTFIISN